MVGRWKLQQGLELAAAAYNLVRLRKLARPVEGGEGSERRPRKNREGGLIPKETKRFSTPC